MKLGIMLEAFKQIPLNKVLEKISNIGYKGVEFFASRGNTHINLDSFDNNNARELKNMLRKYDIKTYSICNSHEAQLILGPHDRSTDHLFKGSSEEKISYGMKRIKKTIEIANMLDVPVITVFTGSPEWGKWYPFPDLNADIWEEYFNVFAERWLPLLDYAKQYNVQLAFEGEPGNLNYNIENTLMLLKRVENHPCMGICYDPSHILWQEMDPIAYIYELGDRIYNVHIKDVEVLNFRKARTGLMCSNPMNTKFRTFRFRVPGWGDIPWKKVISALYEVNYQGAFIVELEDPLISLDRGLELGYKYTLELLSAFYE
ncbi:MAG: sugar phosphate isomerase/epimerase [Nitrososphaeria archaeon]